MRVLTNRLQVRFDIPAIEKDFVFIRIERVGGDKKNWIGAQQLDRLLGDQYKAHAVLFQYGLYAYAMFKRPVDAQEIIGKLRGDGDFDDGAVTVVLPRERRNDGPGVLCEAWLAQILINSLAASRSKFSSFHFCNVTGKLLLVPVGTPKVRGELDVVNVSVSSEWLLNVRVERYQQLKKCTRGVSAGKNRSRLFLAPRYELHPGTGTLKRVFPIKGKKDDLEHFIRKGVKGKKAGMPFLDFSSLEKFDASRMGILDDVLSRIAKELGRYMHVELTARDQLMKMELNTMVLRSVESLRGTGTLEGLKPKIVDAVGSEESGDLAEQVKENMISYFGEVGVAISDQEAADRLNLRIIHDQEYYERSSAEDTYLSKEIGNTVQHMTLENCGEVSNALVKTLVKELLIKREIEQGKLTLFDWPKLGHQKQWSFGAVCGRNEQKRLILMDIDPDGSFGFREFPVNDDLAVFEDGVVEACLEFEHIAGNEAWRTGRKLEGFVSSPRGELNAVFRSDEIGLPPAKDIRELLTLVEAPLPDGMNTGTGLARMVQSCVEENSEKSLKAFVEDLEGRGQSQVSKTEFRQLMNEFIGKTSRTAKMLRAYLADRKGIYLFISRDKDNQERFFNSNLGIRYFTYKDGAVCYLVGDAKGPRKSFQRGCHLREVVPVNGSEVIFQKIMPTLDVDFVRTGQTTVLPFPFKYIREYARFAR